MKDKLLEQIKRYVPVNEQEEADKKLLLDLMCRSEDISVRENPIAHLTTSAWVVSHDRQMVLMAYHKLYNSWAWLGGHADGDWDLCRVAEKEAQEESGIEDLALLSPDPVSIEILPVSGHTKHGKYVPSHLHLNLTYLFEGDTNQTIHNRPDENNAVAWLAMDALSEKCNEPWFVEHIYSKLTYKAKNF